MADRMTAVAKLPEKWREQADYELRQSQDKIWAEWVRDRHLACGRALNRCADELEAALTASLTPPSAKGENSNV